MNTQSTEKTLTPAETIDNAAAELGLTMTATFIPWSKSRNAKEKNPSLNWYVTILRNGRAILDTDYMQGSGHCPSYKAPIKRLGSQDSVRRVEAIKFECENGKRAFPMSGGSIAALSGDKPLQPALRDVLYSLAMDSDVIDYSTFEDWADCFGYDHDSRKAEKIYRACLEIALKLRNSLGDDGLTKLRNACQDY